MLLTEAKAYIGKKCSILFQDRHGHELSVVSKIYDATYVPLYGGYLVTDSDDLRLDRVTKISLVGETVEAAAIHEQYSEKLAA